MKKTVGIVFADAMEYAPFERYALEEGGIRQTRYGNESIEFTAENEVKVIAVKSGIGKANSASATAMLIGCDKVDGVLNAGLSGAVSGCAREDMVIGLSYVECDFDLTPIGYKPGEKPDGQRWLYEADSYLLSLAEKSRGLKKGRLGSGDLFLTDSVKKNQFKETFSINAFDMETGAIAAVCDKCGIPFLSIRKISDDADDAASEDYREVNDRQETCLTQVLMNIIRRMGEG